MVEYFPKWKLPECEEPSDDWIKAFSKRNDMKKLLSSDMEQGRIEMGTTGNIGSWFTETYDPIDLSKYHTSMIANMDESMLQTKSRMVCIVKRTARHAIISESGNDEHITIVTAVTTNGDYPPPLFIFPLKNLPSNIDSMVKSGKMHVSGQESGWIDQTILKNWVIELSKWIKHRRAMLNLPDNAPFLLFVDSHSSRAHSDILKLFRDNFIDTVTYPSHCSHLLQPLDVGIFGPFKKYFKGWRRKLSKTQFTWEGDQNVSERSVTRAKICLAAVNALHQAFAYTHVERGFRLSGIWPRDRNQTLKNDRIVQNDTITMNNNKRKRLPITGAVITDQSIISNLEEMEKEDQKKKKVKKYPFMNSFLDPRSTTRKKRVPLFLLPPLHFHLLKGSILNFSLRNNCKRQ